MSDDVEYYVVIMPFAALTAVRYTPPLPTATCHIIATSRTAAAMRRHGALAALLLALLLALLALCSSALPAGSKSASADSSPVSTKASVQHMKASLLQALHSGAGKLKTLLTIAGPQAVGKLHNDLVHKEYETMTSWWCGKKAPQDSKLCQRRAFAQQLKGMSADAKRKAVQAQAAQASPAARKAMSEEAKQMVDAYCKPAPGSTDAVGAQSSICVRMLSVLEVGKRLIKRQNNKTRLAVPMPLSD